MWYPQSHLAFKIIIKLGIQFPSHTSNISSAQSTLATILTSTDVEHFYHHRMFYWTALQKEWLKELSMFNVEQKTFSG